MSRLLQGAHCGELASLILKRMWLVGRVLVLSLAIRVSSALECTRFLFGVRVRWG